MENSLRPTKLGANNWLFVGRPDAGDRSAIIYSLALSCQRRGKDPLAYFRDALTRLPSMIDCGLYDVILKRPFSGHSQCVQLNAH